MELGLTQEIGLTVVQGLIQEVGLTVVRDLVMFLNQVLVVHIHELWGPSRPRNLPIQHLV